MHTRNTIIMAVLFVLLAGFVYFYEIRGRAEREEAERQAELLAVFEPDQVASLTIDNGGERVVATRVDGSWTITEPRPVEADGEALDTLVDNLHRATHERLVSEATEDLAPFGLAEPTTAVTVTLADGGSHTVAVGNDTPVGPNVYVTTGTGNVYSAARGLRGQLAKTLLDVRDRSVLEFDTTEVRRLEIGHSDYRAALAFDPAAGDDGGWSIEEPFAGRADADTVEDVLTALADAEVEAFIREDRPDETALAEYGLARPSMTIGITTGGDSRARLLVGSESSEPAGRYAMRDGGDSVFVIPAETVADVPAEAGGFRDREVVDLPRERVRAIELTGSDPSVRLERHESDTGWDIVAPRALTADASAVSRLLSTLQDLRAEQFADRFAGDRMLVVRLELENGDPLEIAVGSERSSMVPLGAGDDAEPVDVRTVTSSDGDTIYWVAADELDELTLELLDLRERTLVEFTQTDLTGVEVVAEGTTWTLSGDGESWTLDGDAVEGAAVDDLLWELNYLRMEAVAAEPAPAELASWGLAPPRYRVTATTADGAVAEVSVGDETDSGERFFVQVAGHDGVYEVGPGLADTLSELVEVLRR